MFLKDQYEKLVNLNHVECIMKNSSETGILAVYPNKRISVLAENCTQEETNELLHFIEEQVISDIKCLKSFLEGYRSKKNSLQHYVPQEQDATREEPEPDDPKEPSRHPNLLYHDEKYLVGCYIPSPDRADKRKYRTDAEMLLARNLKYYDQLANELDTSPLIVAILDNLVFLFTEGDLDVTPILTILLSRFADVVSAEEMCLDGYGRESVYKLKPEIKHILAHSKTPPN